MIIQCCAREEWEAGARGEEEIIQRSQTCELKKQGADYPAPTPDYPAPPRRVKSYEAEKFQREKAGADYPPPSPDYPAPPDYPVTKGGLSGPKACEPFSSSPTQGRFVSPVFTLD